MDQGIWRTVVMAGGAAMLLSGCTGAANLPGLQQFAPMPAERMRLVEAESAAVAPAGIDGLIARYAEIYHVPEGLIRRVVARESGFNPRAHNGPYYGLMQIRYDTAMSMGYRGPASGLLEAETNLRYGVKYLAGAYLVGGRDSDQAVRNFSSGYYYQAKHLGLLEEVGL